MGNLHPEKWSRETRYLNMDKKSVAIVVMAVIIGALIGRYVFDTNKKPDVIYVKPGTPVVNITMVDTTIAGEVNPPAVYVMPAQDQKDGMDDSIRVYEQTYTDSSGSSVTVRDSARGVLLRQWVNMKLKNTTITRVDTFYDKSQDGNQRFKFYINGGLSAPGQFASKDGTITGVPASINIGAAATHKGSVFFYNYDPVMRRHSAGAGFKLSLRKRD